MPESRCSSRLDAGSGAVKGEAREAPPAMPADGRSARCKQFGDGLPDRLPGGVGVIGEGGRRVHLEAIPFACGVSRKSIPANVKPSAAARVRHLSATKRGIKVAWIITSSPWRAA